MVNDKRLFYGSCLALITTALSFSIRAGILPQLGEQLNLSAEQLGFINSMWFLGFPLSMVVGGLVYYTVGPKKIMQFAFFAHAVGILLTIYSGSYMGLLISTFLIGLGNGCTEKLPLSVRLPAAPPIWLVGIIKLPVLLMKYL